MAISPTELDATLEIERQLNAEMRSEPLSSPKRLLLLEMVLVCMTYRKMNA